MEGRPEKPPTFIMQEPAIDDEVGLAPMHIRAWRETYTTPESGLTEEMVDELLIL
jgi:hypothetical protein